MHDQDSVADALQLGRNLALPAIAMKETGPIPSDAISADAIQNCWFLCGATASGKTTVGLALARRLGAEIVSLDSMALYRRLDVGTAKPTMAERREVPHHLLDVIDVDREYSLAQYVEAARRSVEDIQARGRSVLFVGGTPLYLKSLLRGIFDGPPADWDLRRVWQRRAAASPPGWLHEQLAAVDPLAAERLHPNDSRRLIRALEVYNKTGRPISDWQQQFERPRAGCKVFALDWPRPALHARIERRVSEMFAAGWIDEVRQLSEEGVVWSRTARQALGYGEILAHLAGELSLEETIDRVTARTRQFARRQLTWLRHLAECRMVPVSEPFEPEAVAERIEALGRVS